MRLRDEEDIRRTAAQEAGVAHSTTTTIAGTAMGATELTEVQMQPQPRMLERLNAICTRGSGASGRDGSVLDWA